MGLCPQQKNMIQTNLLPRLSKIVFCSFLVFQTSANAQLLQEYKTAYPDLNEIILNDKQSYSFSIENKKLKIIQDNHYESMILSEYGIHNNHESFSYSELVKINSYDAYSVVTDKGKERKIKVTQTNEKSAGSRSVFYDNVKERQLTFPNLEAGAKKVYNYQREFLDPYLLHKFVFGNILPVKNSSLEVTVSKDINIGYKIFNDPNNAIKFDKTDRKGKWVYTWTLSDVKAFKFENNAPGVLHLIPHIDVYIKDYKVDNNNVEVLDDVTKLYSYYKGFIVNLNKTEDKPLREIATELTASATTDAQKVKNIFYWVKDNIKYIAFENGYEGFIPREASLVFERKFGDCKDMASIITSMCHYAGVKNVHLSWIGTREIPYSYEQLSTPAVDNHMIAVFDNGREPIFLDATDKATRYGIPTAFIQGKEALVNNGETFRIIKVPVVSSKENQTIETAKLKLENEKITGSGNVQYFGYQRSKILQHFGDASNKLRYEQVKSLVTKGNNKFNLLEYSEANVADRDKPYEISYTFNLNNYVIKTDNELYVNLNLDKFFEKYTVEKDRIAPLEFEYLTYSNSVYEFEIPTAYSVKNLPENLSLNNDLLKADFTYSQVNGKIVLVTQIEMKKMRIDAAEFELWNNTIQQFKNYYANVIILNQK